MNKQGFQLKSRITKLYCEEIRKKYVTFKIRDLIWMHVRRERFPSQTKIKLDPRRSGSYKFLERIGDHAYIFYLYGEFQVSATFHVYDLFHVDVDLNSMRNYLQERGD